MTRSPFEFHSLTAGMQVFGAERRLVFRGGASPVPSGAPSSGSPPTPEELLRKVEMNITSDFSEERKEAIDALHALVRERLQAGRASITPEQIRDAVALAREQVEQRGEQSERERIASIEREFESGAHSRSSAGTPAEVSDIAQPKQEPGKGIGDRIKEFFKGAAGGAIGGLVKAYISFRRMWMDFFPPKDAEAAKKQLDALERLHDRWFGVSEAQAVVSGILKEKGVKIVLVEGQNDRQAYVDMKVKYGEVMKRELEGKNEEQKRAILEAKTFEQFVRGEAESYVDAHRGRVIAGKEYVTTLTGIAKGQQPVEKTAEATVAGAQEGGGGIFSFLGLS